MEESEGNDCEFSNVPWWMFSVGIHGVMLLAALLVGTEWTRSIDGLEVVMICDPARAVGRFSGDRPSDAGLASGRIPPKDSDPCLDLPGSSWGGISDGFRPDWDCHNCSCCCYTGCAYYPPPRSYSRITGSFCVVLPGQRDGRSLFGSPPVRGASDSKANEAVEAALLWLARHQNADGGWSGESFPLRCEGKRCPGAGVGDPDVGATALSILAFLGAGVTCASAEETPNPLRPARPVRYGQVVKMGLQWLLAHQDADGGVGPKGAKFPCNHALATLALAEALDRTRGAPLQDPAQRAADVLVGMREEGGSMIAGWSGMALKSAENEGVDFHGSGARQESAKGILLKQDRASSGCCRGSWDPKSEPRGIEGDRVSATALNTIALEIAVRHPCALGR